MGAPAPRQAINFTVDPRTSATIVSTVLTSLTTNSAPPLPPAVKANQAADVAALSAQATKFWSSFWSKSSVSLPTRPELERFWFSAQYLMGMASRAVRIAPGLWGPWVSTDAPAWCGGCKSLKRRRILCARAVSLTQRGSPADTLDCKITRCILDRRSLASQG